MKEEELSTRSYESYRSLNFLKSAIRSGESWTSECEAHYENILNNLAYFVAEIRFGLSLTEVGQRKEQNHE